MKTETSKSIYGKIGKVMTQFKPASDIEARRAFLEGAEAARQGDVWGTADLKRLSREALIERLDLVDNRATLLRWRILAALRAKFPSDKEYGAYMDEIRLDAEHSHLIGKQQDMNRAALAGKFCEAHGITDLNEAGILKSAVYELSRPQNADVAEKIYKAIKRKSVPIAEVRRMIEEAKAIPGQVTQEAKRIDYREEQTEPVRHLRKEVRVERGVAQIPEVLRQKDDVISELLAGAFSSLGAAEEADEELRPASDEYLSQLSDKFNVVRVDHAAEAALPDYETEEEHEPERPKITVVWQKGMPDRRAPTHEQVEIAKLKSGLSDLERKLAARPPVHAEHHTNVELSGVSYEDMLLELSVRHHEVADLTDQQRVSEILMLDERFNLSPSELITLHQAVIKSYQKLMGVAK